MRFALPDAHRKTLRLAAGALLIVTCACRSSDSAFESADGQPLEEITPVLYSVAVAPIDLAGMQLDDAAAEEKGLHFSMSSDELQQELVAELTRLNAASSVYAVGQDSLAEARARRADLLVQPRLRTAPTLQHDGISKRGFLTVVLWVTTWIGSFFVEDSSYVATFAVDFDIFNPNEGVKIDSVTASSDRVDLTFLDRNALVSWSTLESMIIPPFWTHDQKDSTSRALSQVASARLAARLTRWLKDDLTASEKDFLGEVRLQSPANGAEVGASTSLKGKVIAKAAITELGIYLNDSDVPELDLTEATLAPVAEQRVGNVYQVFIDRDLALRPGKNLISIEVGISGRITSRTIVVYNGKVVPAQ